MKVNLRRTDSVGVAWQQVAALGTVSHCGNDRSGIAARVAPALFLALVDAPARFVLPVHKRRPAFGAVTAGGRLLTDRVRVDDRPRDVARAAVDRAVPVFHRPTIRPDLACFAFPTSSGSAITAICDCPGARTKENLGD